MKRFLQGIRYDSLFERLKEEAIQMVQNELEEARNLGFKSWSTSTVSQKLAILH